VPTLGRAGPRLLQPIRANLLSQADWDTFRIHVISGHKVAGCVARARFVISPTISAAIGEPSPPFARGLWTQVDAAYYSGGSPTILIVTSSSSPSPPFARGAIFEWTYGAGFPAIAAADRQCPPCSSSRIAYCVTSSGEMEATSEVGRPVVAHQAASANFASRRTVALFRVPF
jgi:hypothetical protein